MTRSSSTEGSSSRRGSRRLVLVATTSPDDRDAVVAAVAGKADVCVCEDGVSFLERLGQAPRPDAVVVAAQLPGLSGLDALTLVRCDDPFLPAVVLLDPMDAEAKALARKAGALATLARPISPRDVVGWIELALSCFAPAPIDVKVTPRLGTARAKVQARLAQHRLSASGAVRVARPDL